MDVRYFGPSVWTVLHAIPWCMDLEQAAPLMEALSNVLPCKHCCESLRELLQVMPVKASHSYQLAVWMWRLHNCVNLKVDKPIVSACSALVEDRISREEMVQALHDFVRVLALNYPEQPEQGMRIKYQNFFEVLGRIFELDLERLDEALLSRNQLYAWVLSPGVFAVDGLPDQRSLLEQMRAESKPAKVAVPTGPASPPLLWKVAAV